MKLGQEEIKKITSFVKKEPRTVQEVSKFIGRSWVTTDSYLKQIKDRTGQINIKTFRKGTQGALKLVYYNFGESLESNEVREAIYEQIKQGRIKTDFDFMEIFQFVPKANKKCFLESYDKESVSKTQQIRSLFREAQSVLYCFSGNISFINIKEGKNILLDVMEELLQRKVMIKILCRVNIASLSNIQKLKPLMKKYPGLIEIRHRFQPLRGFIIDDKIARFKDEEQLQFYKKGELGRDTRIFYETRDDEWVQWLQKVFWNLFRPSMDYKLRLQEIEKAF